MALPVLYVHDELVHNKLAARIILPHVFRFRPPVSVLDVGCGLGTWLSVCNELGVTDYLGVDGDYVDRTRLTIPSANFKSLDLRTSVELGRKFDLVLCLEVAEHIPEFDADRFVKNVTHHGDMILFSAAIPGQGGQNHVNEQWPAYWEDKFKRYGFYYHDLIRPKVWNDEGIQWWYRQNIFLLTKEKPDSPTFPSNAVHPALFDLAQKNQKELLISLKGGRQGVRIAFEIFFNSVAFKIRRIFQS